MSLDLIFRINKGHNILEGNLLFMQIALRGKMKMQSDRLSYVVMFVVLI